MAHGPCPRLADLPPPPRGARGWPWTEETPPAAGSREWPTITIVTPSFNQARFVEGTIRSVLLQGYPALEYVVLDGGSTDGSAEIIRKYARWLAHWRSAPDGGQSDALNEGLSRATGRIAGWLNSDDRFLPGALQGVARLSADRPAAVAWAGRCRSVTPDGTLVHVLAPRGLTRDALADWPHTGHIPQPSCLFSREAAAAVGFLDRDLHFALDVDFWLKLAARGEVAAAGEVWAEEILHADAKTSAQYGKSLAEVHRVQLRHGYEALAFRRMSEELQEYAVLKRGAPMERLRQQLSIALQPILSRLRQR